MEIINIGTDIEEVSRIARLNQKTLRRVFTEAELKYCAAMPYPARHLAARFAAKEAVFKALPFDGLALKKIEVIKDKSGKPQVLVDDARAKKMGFKVSLSHSAKYATAFVIVYKL